MGKKVLILGNGFDLAHDLPTRYSDFLKFCKMTELLHDCHVYYEKTYSLNFDSCVKYMNDLKINLKIKGIFLEVIERNIDVFNAFLNANRPMKKEYFSFKEIYSYTEDNIWFHYFWQIYNNNLNIGENWIDFEEEIGEIIQILNVRINKTNKMNFTFNDLIKYFNRSNSNPTMMQKKFEVFKDIINKNNLILTTMNDLSSRLYKDLNNLIFALEIYLSDFVNKWIYH